jgi:carbamoyltransferase
LSYILGINAYHADSSACLLHQGQLIAAAEEERFNRLKHWSGFPTRAIQFCLQEAGLSLHEIDYIAQNRRPWSNMAKKFWFILTNRPDKKLVGKRLAHAGHWLNIKKQLLQALGIDSLRAQICFVEHHHAHLASSFFVSPMERAAILSVDGFGDFSSVAWGIGTGSRLQIMARVFFPHSLGLLYLALTQYLGFCSYGDEYKVMGLAAYGQPSFIKEMEHLIHLLPRGQFRLDLRYFCHHSQNFTYEWHNTIPQIGKVYTDNLIKLLGPPRSCEEPVVERHQDIACSLQLIYERALYHILNYLHDQTQIDSLCLAGGCAMNSVANGKISNHTPFKNLYIQPAPGDAGGAIGAAFVAWHEIKKRPRNFIMEHALWGPSYNKNAIISAIEARTFELTKEGCIWELILEEEHLLKLTAEAIAEGKVVGFFQGRMEWGPRALGNRSILADPRRSNMKDILNLKIKRRESFRPFAPSILREAVSEYFEKDDDVPFMLQVFKVIPEKRSAIPAVTHIDGSGRLQTVSANNNLRYYRLIKKFRDITGIPIVLNTSFNENEPLVNLPEEALDCFIRTQMDILVLEDYFISRQEHR